MLELIYVASIFLQPVLLQSTATVFEKLSTPPIPIKVRAPRGAASCAAMHACMHHAPRCMHRGACMPVHQFPPTRPPTTLTRLSPLLHAASTPHPRLAAHAPPTPPATHRPNLPAVKLARGLLLPCALVSHSSGTLLQDEKCRAPPQCVRHGLFPGRFTPNPAAYWHIHPYRIPPAPTYSYPTPT